jgi:hypothetical protein
LGLHWVFPVQASPGERRAARNIVGGEDVMTSGLVDVVVVVVGVLSIVIGSGVAVEVMSVVLGSEVTFGVAVVTGGPMLLAKDGMERTEVGSIMVIAQCVGAWWSDRCNRR